MLTNPPAALIPDGSATKGRLRQHPSAGASHELMLVRLGAAVTRWPVRHRQFPISTGNRGLRYTGELLSAQAPSHPPADDSL